jgi:hypothetical protein
LEKFQQLQLQPWTQSLLLGFAIVECDYILELIEKEIERTSSILERLEFCRSSQVCCERLRRQVTRSDIKYELCGIVDALGLLKDLCAADCEHVDAHQERELEHAEGTLLQALHFAKRLRDYHLCCTLSMPNLRKFNLDCDWSDMWDEEAVECHSVSVRTTSVYFVTNLTVYEFT